MTTRESLLWELALEWLFQRPFTELVDEACRTGRCTEIDLLQLGYRVFHDAVRMARGEISSIHVPARLPNDGEHSPHRLREAGSA